jgi:hypothetical protein
MREALTLRPGEHRNSPRRPRRGASRSPGAGGRTGSGTRSQQVWNRASRHEYCCRPTACYLWAIVGSPSPSCWERRGAPKAHCGGRAPGGGEGPMGEISDVGTTAGSPSPSCWERGLGGEGLIANHRNYCGCASTVDSDHFSLPLTLDFAAPTDTVSGSLIGPGSGSYPEFWVAAVRGVRPVPCVLSLQVGIRAGRADDRHR